jgi:hypothetical protein
VTFAVQRWVRFAQPILRGLTRDVRKIAARTSSGTSKGRARIVEGKDWGYRVHHIPPRGRVQRLAPTMALAILTLTTVASRALVVLPGLAPVIAPQGVLIAYATAPGQTAADGA